MLRRILAASATVICAIGLGAGQASAVTTQPQATSVANDCKPGTPLDGFRQEFDSRTEAKLAIVWNYCAPDQRMSGYASDINGGHVDFVWMERATEGPNPATWTGPYGKKPNSNTGAPTFSKSLAFGSYWWRTCADVTTAAGTKVTECGSWYHPSTMLKPV